MNKTTIPQEYWLAIQENNAAYDGQFYYGVTTTNIVCRPSCRSRVPKRENIAIYRQLETAVHEAFGHASAASQMT
ncbi:ADA regulatory protein [Bacillus sp. JCM 19046]|nr:ADA regulatory protein [Bacillus sp. JCM 19045]GAF18041.1 ADA regulatory protein [Bacillus sp. JCM 19046]